MFEIIDIHGAKLIFSRLEGLRTTSLGVFVNAGARYEDRHLKGIAHFLEHMVFKGSNKYSYKAIKEEIEGRGGLLNGFTSQETTAYYSQCLSTNIYKTLDILLDMVFFPSLDAKEMEKERNVVLEEVKMHNDLPSTRASAILDKLLWDKHPLGEEVIGYSDTIADIKREDLVRFKNKFYVPGNIIVVCVADCARDDLTDRIRNKLKSICKIKSGYKTYSPKPLNKIKVSTERKEINQAHICVGFRGPSYRSRDRFTVELLHVIMGANMSSRLFEEIRERRGLCYDISTEVRRFKDSGAFCIHTGLDVKNITTALRKIFRQIDIIKNKKVGSNELTRAKDYLFGQIIMGLEKPEGRMFYLADSYLAFGRVYTEERIRDLIEGIGPERIMAFAEKIFGSGKVCVSCVSNRDKDMEREIVDLVSIRA